MKPIAKFSIALSDDQVKELYNNEILALCERCTINGNWHKIGETFDMNFCDICNQPANLNYVE